MDVAQVYLEIYTKIHTRFGSYIIGLGLGYILYKTRSKVKMPVVSIINTYIISFNIFMLFYIYLFSYSIFDQKIKLTKFKNRLQSFS